MVAETETAEEVQAPADAPQVEEAAPVEVEASTPETETVPESGDGQGELDTLTEEEVAPSTVRLSREEVLEQYADVFTDEANTVRQRAESELRRNAGTQEATRARVREVAEKWGVDRAKFEADPTLLDLPNTLNELNVTERLLRAYAVAAAGEQGLNEAEQATVESYVETIGGGALSKHAGHVLSISTGRAESRGRDTGQDSIYDMDVTAAVAERPDSTLAKTYRAAQERSDAEAVQAVTLEQNAEASPGKRPATPANGAPSGPTTYDDVSWVRDQMNQDTGWLNKLSPDGKTTNLQRANPAIMALARQRKEQRAQEGL